jgi:hypothetical protein
MALIGDARVSTDEPHAAGCTVIHEEYASGGRRAGPVLAQVLRRMRAGHVLVVVRLDRLARSLSDPVDIVSPQGGRAAAADRQVPYRRKASEQHGSWNGVGA